MGKLIDVVNQFDTSGEQKDEITETLNLLVELTKARAEHFKQEIEDDLNRSRIIGKEKSIDSLRPPISSVIDSRVEYRCVTQDGSSDIIDKIMESISTIINKKTIKNILKGIANTINEALIPLLGQASGSEKYCKATYTFIEGSGNLASIVRLDWCIWGRSVSAKSIKEKIDTTLACVAYKSVVNAKQITFDTFRTLYMPILEASEITDTREAIKYAREVYDLLEGGSELPKSQMSIKDDFEYKKLTISDLIYHSDSIMTNDGKF